MIVFDKSCLGHALVISGFPGVGKSTFFKANSVYSDEAEHHKSQRMKILDSDSSKFHLIYPDGVKKLNPEWPNNYLSYIKEHLLTEDIIMVSSHKETRDLLKSGNIPYALIYPPKSMKDAWIKRIRERGSDENFCKMMEEKYYEFVKDCKSDKYAIRIQLVPGEYEGINTALITAIMRIIRFKKDKYGDVFTTTC